MKRFILPVLLVISVVLNALFIYDNFRNSEYIEDLEEYNHQLSEYLTTVDDLQLAAYEMYEQMRLAFNAANRGETGTVNELKAEHDEAVKKYDEMLSKMNEEKRRLEAFANN